MEMLRENYQLTQEYIKETKVPRGDDDWFKHGGLVIQKMSKEYPESKKYLLDFLVDHMMDTLLFNEKVEVMNYLYSLDTIQNGTFEWFAKDYFDKKSIKTKNFNVMILYKLNKRMIMILNENNKWVEATPEDQIEIANAKETKQMLSLTFDNFNKIIGFIGYEKKNTYLVFKTKDMTSKRDTGARCDEAGKAKTMAKLNEILDSPQKYTAESTVFFTAYIIGKGNKARNLK
jgi:hypothetical protein